MRQCRICKETEFKEVINFGKVPLVNSLLTKEEWGTEKVYPLIIEQCQNCFLVQVVSPVSTHEIYEAQDYLYYTGDMPQNSQYMKAFDSLINDIQEKYTQDCDLIVEIGSNDGFILKKFKDREVLGVDPATNVVIRALARGVPTLSAGFNEHNAKNIAKEFGKAQVIGGANCLAHIDDIHGVLRGVYALLAYNGIFWVECNYWGGMVKNKHYALIYHDHYSYYTLQHWIDLLKMYNMEVFDAFITEAQGEGLSLRLFASHENHEKTQRFLDLLDEERITNLNSYKTAKQYSKDIINEARKLHDVIENVKMKGKKIAGYGAAAKGFSVLKLAGITHEHIEYFIDDSPAKQGKYTPVTHIPIVARKDAASVDYFFITAPNYKDVIIEKEKDFIDSGGKFITIEGEII